MGYRGDRDALLAQVEALRVDLAEAEREAAELGQVKAELADKRKALARLEKKVAAYEGRAQPASRVPLLFGLLALLLAAGAGAYYWTITGEQVMRGDRAEDWFASIKARCNPLEVDSAMAREKAPRGDRGLGYKAACFALAGKIDEARRVIDEISPNERYRAAGIVFEIAHPIADAGDDKAAGPIMEMVLHYWPNNFQAEYHAGMAAFGVGDRARAKARLTHFVATYKNDDTFRKTAIETLKKLP